MIQLSPHVETAYIDYVPPASAESLQIHEPETEDVSEDREEFAEILAGLLHKTGFAEAKSAAGEDGSGFGAALVEEAEVFVGVESSPDEAQNHRLWPGIAEGKPTEDGFAETEHDLSGPELVDDGQTHFLAADRLLTRSVEENQESVDRISALDRPADKGLLAGFDQVDAVDTAAAEISDGAQNGGQLTPQQFAADSSLIDREKAKGKTRNGEAAILTAQHGNMATENSETADRINLKKFGEKEGRTKLEVAREKRRGAPIEVRDFRSANAQAAESSANSNGTQFKANAETRVPTEAGPREITLELRLPNQGQNAPAAGTSWEAKAGQAFTDLLARELHQNFNNDIVRHASMALRDEGAGTIRLALKPETLGNVKIHLEMAENKITGLIVVESEEALRAFEREIRSLEQAFRDSGFEGANLEMSLAADGRGTDQQWQETEASQFLSEQQVASRYDASIERVETPVIVDLYQRGTALINVFA